MRLRHLRIPLLITAAIGAGLLINGAAPKLAATVGDTPQNAEATASVKTPVTISRSPSCGCCGSYISYLEGKGYDVKTEFIKSDAERLDRHGIPDDMASCHTIKIGAYVVEGHVPEEAVKKLLDEQPDIRGIALPGMPFGSPGMPGEKEEDFTIYRLEKDGTTSPFVVI